MVGTDAAIADVCTAAYAELESLRVDCRSGEKGCGVMRAMAHCMKHQLTVPDWLRSEFLRRWSMVNDAHVGTWDEAYGRPFPPHTRLESVRRRRELRVRVHGAVWRLVKENPDRPMTRVGLFDEVGEQRGISLSASQTEKLYYEAVSEGSINVDDWRRAHLQRDRSSRGIARKPKDEGSALAT